MKILYLTRDYTQRASAYSLVFPLERALKATGKVEIIARDTHKKYGRNYDVEVLDGKIFDVPKLDYKKVNEYDFMFFENLFPYWFEDWDKIDIPIILGLEDLHGYVPGFLDEVFGRIDVKAIFTKYYTPYLSRYGKKYEVPLFHWPHCAGDIHKDYGLKKEWGALHIGTMGGDYKLRSQIYETLYDKPYFRRIERQPNALGPSAWPIGEDYARELNKAKIVFNCSSRYQYVVAKFFEIPACRSLMICDYPPDLDRLGFIPDLHYVPVYPAVGIEKTVDYWLRNDKKRQEVTDAGYEYIHKEHMAENRAEEFIQYCECLKEML
jgi:hypothetical protein